MASFEERIAEELPQAMCQPTLPSAAAMGKIAVDWPSVDSNAFLPHYLKKVEAEETWLKTHDEGNPDDYIKMV